MKPGDLAAILFTTGSTGPPKGVCYEHSVFRAQLELIRDYYQIGPGDIDQPAFPLFALLSVGLGACSVVPEMNPARPASVDPIQQSRGACLSGWRAFCEHNQVVGEHRALDVRLEPIQPLPIATVKPKRALEV